MKKITALLITTISLATPNITHAETPDLSTKTNNEIGFSLSAYRYQEPELMSLKGVKIGADLRTTKALQKEQFIRGELRYAFGIADYNSNGTGSSSGEPDLYIEARGLAGNDWAYNDDVIAAYAGLGYRYLFNDGRGISCTVSQCYWGYRRESNYFYLPVGVIYRGTLNDQARLVSTLEYDHLLLGKQISRLSDGGQGDSDATNTQNKGYGLRLNIMYEKDNWSAGPYLNYWSIEQSDIVPSIKNGVQVYKNSVPMGWAEPKNNTVEFGVRTSKQF